MLRDILTLSALILVVLLVRAMFKNRVPKRMLYCLWLVVLLKLCLPGTLFSLPVLPAEDAAAPVLRTELPAQTAPVVQQPTQTAPQPQTPAQPPVSPAQEAAKPAAKPLTTTQILQIVWFGGSALLGLWLFGAWMVFTFRLRKSRKFLGKHGRTRIYVSNRVKSPCLAGLIPAVYLTQDVLQTEDVGLILRHELTHLHHLDFLWSFCRAAAVTVYWWNPFIWLAAILSKRDAELACDEAVAAKLSESKRLAYARAILAQAPRKTAALSLAGPPVKERILFLTKKQRTSVLCVILALLLVVSATGCSFAELTRQKSGEITLPEDASSSSPEAAPQEEASSLPVMDTPALPAEAAAWVKTYLSARYTVLDTQTFDFDGNSYILLLVGSDNPSVTGYQVFALEQNDGAYVLYAWNESYGWDPSLEDMVCAMRTDTFAAVYGFTGGSDPAFDMLELTLDDGSEETVSIEPNTPFLHVIPGRLKEVQNITLSGSETNTKQNIGRGWNGRPDYIEDTYPMNDSIWSRVHARLDCGHWVPEYEDGVREFELEDSKRSDLPGDFFQWPRYYSAFVDYFCGMNADLSYLDQNAFWTKDLSEDGQTMIVTMTPGNGDLAALTLSYSLQTQEISSGDRLPAIVTLTIYDLSTSPSSKKTYTLSTEDAAALEELFSIDSMTPTTSDSESVCAYQFDVGNRSYLLDESLGLAEAVVRVDADHYEYYQKRLTNAESEILKAIITRCRQSTLQTAIIQQVSDDSITVEHIVLLNSYLEEDLQTLKELNIPPEEYQYGYYRRDSGEIYTYAVDPDTPVTIYDISQVYGAGEDRLYTFETWQDFVTAVQANEGLIIQPYTLTIQDGVVIRIVEKFYN